MRRWCLFCHDCIKGSKRRIRWKELSVAPPCRSCESVAGAGVNSRPAFGLVNSGVRPVIWFTQNVSCSHFPFVPCAGLSCVTCRAVGQGYHIIVFILQDVGGPNCFCCRLFLWDFWWEIKLWSKALSYFHDIICSYVALWAQVPAAPDRYRCLLLVLLVLRVLVVLLVLRVSCGGKDVERSTFWQSRVKSTAIFVVVKTIAQWCSIFSQGACLTIISV